MRANTIEQYKILKFIEENFNLQYITIELISSDKVKVIDKKNDQIIFTTSGNEVVWMESK